MEESAMNAREEPGVEVPRTTTTGDEEKGFRHAGDSALDRSSDTLHHPEDDGLAANTQGIVAAWKARWRRRPSRNS